MKLNFIDAIKLGVGFYLGACMVQQVMYFLIAFLQKVFNI